MKCQDVGGRPCPGPLAEERGPVNDCPATSQAICRLVHGCNPQSRGQTGSGSDSTGNYQGWSGKIIPYLKPRHWQLQSGHALCLRASRSDAVMTANLGRKELCACAEGINRVRAQSRLWTGSTSRNPWRRPPWRPQSHSPLITWPSSPGSLHRFVRTVGARDRDLALNASLNLKTKSWLVGALRMNQLCSELKLALALTDWTAASAVARGIAFHLPRLQNALQTGPYLALRARRPRTLQTALAS
jgi:hypothetical protein